MALEDALASAAGGAAERQQQQKDQSVVRTRRDRSATWVLDATSVDGTSSSRSFIQLEGRHASLEGICENAIAGDLVLLPLDTIQVLIQYTNLLLGRGLTVAINCAVAPALCGPLGSRLQGDYWVKLTPKRPARVGGDLYRLVDIIVGVFALVSLSPFLAAVAIAIGLTSPGPVLFRSKMVGRKGRVFDLFKFRSMRPADVNAGEALRKDLYRDYMALRGPVDGRHLKVLDESRVTTLGRFLRRHSLDEVPQFWNVVRGDLALVGARPCLPYEYDLYESWHRSRFRGKPGLTGLWQAYGRGTVTFEQMVLMDYCYSWRKSLRLDLRIVARTALVVLNGEGGK